MVSLQSLRNPLADLRKSKVIFTILLLLLFSIQNIVCQPTIPRHFDVAIHQLRDYYYNYQHQQPNWDNLLHIAIKYDRFLENISFSADNTIPCERDMEILIEAATNRQLWALKVHSILGVNLYHQVCSKEICIGLVTMTNV